MLFSDNGKLADIERKWTAVKKYALLVDQSHSTALEAVRDFLGDCAKAPPSNESELDDVILASLELDALSESDSVLARGAGTALFGESRFSLSGQPRVVVVAESD